MDEISGGTSNSHEKMDSSGFLLDLVEDVQEMILNMFSMEDLILLSLCSRAHRDLCQHYLWKRVQVPLCFTILGNVETYCVLEHLQYTEELTLIGVEGLTDRDVSIAINNST